jgi:hypothetical protein
MAARAGAGWFSLALRFWPAFVVGGFVLGAGGLAAFFAAQATHWSVMSDELQTTKLATSIADTGSILPRIHGEGYGGLSQQLYPLVLAPFFAFLDVPAAMHAAHIVNGFLLASAAVPAYLLARDVAGSRAAGCVAAALTAFMPWLVLSSTLLTENAAYPAFVWGVLLCHRAMVKPSLWRDLGALAGLALVFLARTQLFVLAAAFPVALLAHETGYAAGRGAAGRLKALGGAARRCVSSHPLLASVYLVGAMVVAALAVSGNIGDVFGQYEGTLRGDLLPPGIWEAAAAHIGYVVVAFGIAPFLLTVSWAAIAIVEPRRREAHAFAVLVVLLIPLLVFEVASFDLRFTPGAFVQDRYLFYVAPLLAVGASAALLEPRRRRERAALVLASGAAFVGLASATSFSGGTVIFWASPASAFHPALAEASGWLALSADSLVLLAGLAITGVLAILLVCARPAAALAAVGVAVASLGVVETVYVFERYAVPATTVAREIPTARADWIDAANGSDESVTVVPNPYLGEKFWWDAEFWNRTVRRVLAVDGGPTFTPFPAQPLSIDPRTGRVLSGLSTDLLVQTSVETRFRLAGSSIVASASPLELARVERPHRAEWTTAGADQDGWARPRQPVRLRIFPAHGSGTYLATVALSPPPGLSRPARVVLRTNGSVRSATLYPDTPLRMAIPVCVEAERAGRATLSAAGGSAIPDGRLVSLHLDAIDVRPTQEPCGR